MNISSCNLNVLNNSRFVKPLQSNLQVLQNPILKSFVQPSIQNYQAYALNNISFGKIFNKKVDYSNREEYLEYMDKRIKDTVHNRSEEEISAMIDEIAKENDVPQKQVQEVIARVVQFTSYSQLPQIYSIMQEYGVNRFSEPYSPNYADLNNVFEYIGRRKHQIIKGEYEPNDKRVEGLILDDRTIAHIKDLKNADRISEKGRDYKMFVDGINDGSIKLFVIDGWNTKIDGKDMSYGAFGAQNDLKTVVSSIVKEQKNTGKSLDEIMNADIINQAKELFGEDVEVNVIKNPLVKKTDVSRLTKLLHHNAPDNRYIDELFNALKTVQLNNPKYSEEDKKIWIEILSEYYDKALCIYSPETLNDEMRTLYSNIEKRVNKLGKTMDDVVYLIPNLTKSFEVVNYQYAKVNNVPSNQFIFHDGTGFLKQTDYGTLDLKDKVAVVIDDFAGSGDSLRISEFRIDDFDKKNKRVPLIIATVCALSDASEKIRKEMKKIDNKAYFITNREFDYYKDFRDKLPVQKGFFVSEEVVSGNTLLYPNGYKKGSACVAFPYMLPDNNMLLSNLLLNGTNNNSINNSSNNLQEILDLIKSRMKK